MDRKQELECVWNSNILRILSSVPCRISSDWHCKLIGKQFLNKLSGFCVHLLSESLFSFGEVLVIARFRLYIMFLHEKSN